MNTELLKNRAIKLKDVSGQCESCHLPADTIRHIDSKDDHSLDNLTVLCWRCFRLLYPRNSKNTSKFTREYGMTLRRMSEVYGGSPAIYAYRHKQGKLHAFLNEMQEDNLSEHLYNLS